MGKGTKMVGLDHLVRGKEPEVERYNCHCQNCHGGSVSGCALLAYDSGIYHLWIVMST